MRFRSKRYRGLIERRRIEDPKPLPEAVGLVKEMATAKFNESVDLSLHLNLDARKADQQVRGSFSLPHGSGREVRIVAFTDDPALAEECLAGGAIKAGADDLVAEIQEGFMDFDVAIASPKMMRVVGRLGKLLGPRGLMPAPKSGTVTEDVVAAVKEFRAGRIEFRADSAGNINVRVGTVAFDEQQLVENIDVLTKHIRDQRPASVRGEFVSSATVSSTMGPGIRVQL